MVRRARTRPKRHARRRGERRRERGGSRGRGRGRGERARDVVVALAAAATQVVTGVVGSYRRHVVMYLWIQRVVEDNVKAFESGDWYQRGEREIAIDTGIYMSDKIQDVYVQVLRVTTR